MVGMAAAAAESATAASPAAASASAATPAAAIARAAMPLAVVGRVRGAPDVRRSASGSILADVIIAGGGDIRRHAVQRDRARFAVRPDPDGLAGGLGDRPVAAAGGDLDRAFQHADRG